MTLDTEQLRALGRDGFLVIPEVATDRIGAARRAVERIIAEQPPPATHRGFHFYWRNHVTPPDPLLACLSESPAFDLVEALIAPNKLAMPDQIQISINIPPWKHRPGGPHLDGLTPPEADGRPGTFSLLAGIFLTDQVAEDMGNLWVWPGTHWTNARYLREHGSDALLANAPYPPTPLPKPVQVIGRAGGLLLAHYLLGHNMGGNLASQVRKVLYFRLRAQDHRQHWRACMQDPLFELGSVRATMR